MSIHTWTPHQFCAELMCSTPRHHPSTQTLLESLVKITDLKSQWPKNHFSLRSQNCLDSSKPTQNTRASKPHIYKYSGHTVMSVSEGGVTFLCVVDISGRLSDHFVKHTDEGRTSNLKVRPTYSHIKTVTTCLTGQHQPLSPHHMGEAKDPLWEEIFGLPGGQEAHCSFELK